MNTSRSQKIDNGPEIVLPDSVTSKEGYKFNTAGSWHLLDQVSTFNFHFDEFAKYFDRTMLLSFQSTLLLYIRKHSLGHAGNMYSTFLRFLRTTLQFKSTPITAISSTDILNYKAAIGYDEWHLTNLRGFLRTWKRLGYPGIDDEAHALLDSLRLKGNTKGEAVLTMDPTTGPFTENELLSIHEELCENYKKGSIGNREFALVWLFMALGLRLAQFAMLKIKDFSVIPASDGSSRYVLNMPRAKQRGVTARELFSERVLCTEAGIGLAVWIEQLKTTRYYDAIGDELPIFPLWDQESTIGLHHITSYRLGVELKREINRLNVISERTGEPINFQSKRFRYTIGTRAAEEGLGELVIAQLLDQEDTQNVRIYIEATAKMAGVIDKAMSPYMAPIAQAFKGMIIRSDKDCPDGILVRSGHADGGAVGKCGQHGFCRAAAPHVCYVCINFRPWLDGPHEEVLKELIDEKERVLAATNDKRIAGAKDRIIMAVNQVVAQCNEMKMQG